MGCELFFETKKFLHMHFQYAKLSRACLLGQARSSGFFRLPFRSQDWFPGFQARLSALCGFQAGQDPAQAIRKFCIGVSDTTYVAVDDPWFSIGHNSLGTGLPWEPLRRRQRDWDWGRAWLGICLTTTWPCPAPIPAQQHPPTHRSPGEHCGMGRRRAALAWATQRTGWNNRLDWSAAEGIWRDSCLWGKNKMALWGAS